MIPLPENAHRTNAGQRCDMADGPCACGAWHFAVTPTFERKIIDAPAQCVRCNARYQSPTTGKLMNDCHCGGELVPDLRDVLAPAIKPVGKLRSGALRP